MKWKKQKKAKEEVDEFFPRRRDDWEYNLVRCKFVVNALTKKSE